MGEGLPHFGRTHKMILFIIPLHLSDNGVFDNVVRIYRFREAHAIIREIAKLLPEELGLVSAGGGGADVALPWPLVPCWPPLTPANREWPGPGSAADLQTGELADLATALR